MQHYLWYALGGLLVVLATIGLTVLIERSHAKTDAGLTPEELKRKKTLEDMADNIGPLP